jgi:hypothetical protein
MKNTVEIGTFTDYFQATLAKEILESNNVHCIITGINLNMLDKSETRISLIINKDDFNEAEQLLASFFPKA